MNTHIHTVLSKLYLFLEKYQLLFLLVLLLFFVSVTIPAIFTTKHQLNNLEPYPDGLLYVVPAINLAEGQGFGLYASEKFIRVWLPPLYSLLLVPFFLVNSSPNVFVVSNVVLGCLTLFFTWQTAKNITKNFLSAHLSVIFLLLHGYFLYLITLPLSENALLFLISAALYMLTQEIKTKTQIGTLLTITIGLVMTRFSLAPTAIVVFLLVAVKLKSEQPGLIKHWIIGSLLGAVFFSLYQVFWLNFNPLLVFQPGLETKTNSEILFFSIHYLVDNLSFYVKAFSGLPIRFLWLASPFTSLSFVVASVASVFSLLRHQKSLFSIWAIQASLLFLFLFFYVQDSRYVIGMLPGFSILTAVTIDQLIKNKKYVLHTAVVVFFIISTLVLSQLGVYKQVLASNILHRSVAWQYEAVQTIKEAVVPSSDSYVITVLPPVFVKLYTDTEYQLLPLTHDQEFMNQGQQLYSLPLNDLESIYQKLLENDKNLYISTGYLSNQASFGTQWQEIQSVFQVDLVRSGCLDTCNVYKIMLKDEETL